MSVEAAGHIVGVKAAGVHSTVWKITAHVYTENQDRIVVKWLDRDRVAPLVPGSYVHVTLNVDAERIEI